MQKAAPVDSYIDMAHVYKVTSQNPECGFHSSGHVVVNYTVLVIVLTGHLISLLGLTAGNHLHHDILQILVAAAECGRLLPALGRTVRP